MYTVTKLDRLKKFEPKVSFKDLLFVPFKFQLIFMYLPHHLHRKPLHRRETRKFVVGVLSLFLIRRVVIDHRLTYCLFKKTQPTNQNPKSKTPQQQREPPNPPVFKMLLI